MTFFSETQSS